MLDFELALALSASLTPHRRARVPYKNWQPQLEVVVAELQLASSSTTLTSSITLRAVRQAWASAPSEVALHTRPVEFQKQWSRPQYVSPYP
jgi:hypothetical protein